MKNKMIKISTKISTAMVVAASVMTMASITAFAADDTVIADETVVIEEVAATEEAPECEMTVPETEGQGDVIDDEFAYVEGQGDVIDDEFAYVEGQGDVIDDEFAYVEGQGDIIDDQFAVAPEAEEQPAAETVAEAPVAKAKPQTVNGTYEDDPELSEEDKSEETKKLEEIYKSLFPVKKTLHADDETLDKLIEEGMSDNPDKAFVESTKELAKLIANTVDAQATDAACPFMGQFQNLVKQRLLLSKANDAKTPELKAKYMREAQEAAEDNLMESIMPGVAGLQTAVDAGKIVVKQAFGEKGKQIFGDLCDTSKEYAPCFGTLAISNRANALLRKANEAKTPEMKGKYLKEYDKACTKLKFSYFPGGAAVYDLFTKVPKWFA